MRNDLLQKLVDTQYYNTLKENHGLETAKDGIMTVYRVVCEMLLTDDWDLAGRTKVWNQKSLAEMEAFIAVPVSGANRGMRVMIHPNGRKTTLSSRETFEQHLIDLDRRTKIAQGLLDLVDGNIMYDDFGSVQSTKTFDP